MNQAVHNDDISATCQEHRRLPYHLSSFFLSSIVSGSWLPGVVVHLWQL